MNQRTMIVANWKMHLNVAQSSLLIHRLNLQIKAYHDIEIVLAPSLLALQPVSLQIDRRKFRLSAQDGYSIDEGAYTGQVSFTMMRGLIHYCIIGHSGRRIYFHETLEEVRDKMAAAVRNEITPILCVGETKEERRNGETRQVLHDQIETALHELTAREVAKLVIAYEPVWAITTFDGEIAKPDVVAREVAFIRKQVAELYGDDTAAAVRILYGGSVDEFDARSYLELEGCNGVLVGAASLNYHKFTAIVESAHRMLGN